MSPAAVPFDDELRAAGGQLAASDIVDTFRERMPDIKHVFSTPRGQAEDLIAIGDQSATTLPAPPLQEVLRASLH